MMEPQGRWVSCFPSAERSGYPVSAAKLGGPVTLGRALNWIRSSERLAALQAAYRAAIAAGESDDALRALKARTLKAITPSASFAGRRAASGAWRHTGAVVLDFDHVDEPERVRAAAADVRRPDGFPVAIAAFISPSGDGVKVIAHTSPQPRTVEGHAEAWERARDAFEVALGLSVDPSGADVSRLTYLAHDPDCILRAARETRALQ